MPIQDAAQSGDNLLLLAPIRLREFEVSAAGLDQALRFCALGRSSPLR